MGKSLVTNDNEFHDDAKGVIKLGSSIMETCGTLRLHTCEANLASFCFSYVPSFPTPRSFTLGILSAWKAHLMAKVSTKMLLFQKGLSLQLLPREAPSFIMLWILFCFLSNTLLSSCLAYLLIELFMVLLPSSGMHTPQLKWFYLVHFLLFMRLLR